MQMPASEAYIAMRGVLTDALGIQEEVLNAGLNTSPTDFRAQAAAMFFMTQADHARSILAMELRRDAALIARSMYEGDLKLRWLLSNPDFPEDSDFKAKQWHAQGWRVDYESLYRRRDRLTQYRALTDEEESKFQTEKRELLHGIEHFQDFLLTEVGKQWLLAGARLSSQAFQKVFPAVETMCQRLGFDATYYDHYRSMSEYSHFGLAGISQIWKFDTESARRSIVVEEPIWSCWCLSMAGFSFLGSMAAIDALACQSLHQERTQALIARLSDMKPLR